MKSYCMKIKKLSSAKEIPENIEFDFDENELYRIENMCIYDIKEKLEWRKCAFEC